MKNIAYFTNQYPMVSHSFIRREIRALEAQNIHINRIAIRANYDDLVDSQDKAELEKTTLLSEAPIALICLAISKSIITHPLKSTKGLLAAVRLGWRSQVSILKHIVYLVEACALKEISDTSAIEHVHVHFGTNPATIALLCKILGGPSYSFTVHGPEEFDKPEALGLREKIRNATFVAAVSSFGRSQLCRWAAHSDWEKIKVVRCGINSEEYLDSPNIIQKQSRQLICVGRLCEQKAQLLLLEAFSELAREDHSLTLVLAGDGPMREEIQNAIQRLNLTDQVELTGWLTNAEVRSRIEQSIALVLPSFAEGLPVVIMEAMAAKRIVISTHIAGIPELVVNGETGFLVPAGNVDELRDAINKTLNMNPDELSAMTDASQKRVFKLHDVQDQAKIIAQYLQDSIERP